MVDDKWKNEEMKDEKEAKDHNKGSLETVEGLLEEFKLITCVFCKAWGHKVKGCPAIKGMNRKCGDLPAMKIAWGRMKS